MSLVLLGLKFILQKKMKILTRLENKTKQKQTVE